MGDLVDLLIPEEQQEGTEVEVSAWLKRVGDSVVQDEPICELTTDKAVVELAAPATGVLVEVLVKVDTRVELDAVLGRIRVETSSEAPMAKAPLSKPEAEAGASDEPAASSSGPAAVDGEARPSPHPAVLRYARLQGVNLGAISGSGKDGRVTAADLGRPGAIAKTTLATRPADRAPTPSSPSGAPSVLGRSRLVRHDPMRRSIARHMADSVQTAPHVTAAFSCDLTRVMAHREAHKASLASQGVKLTFTAYFLQAMADGIREVPEVNSRWHDDGLEVFESVHVGVGTALEDQGLVVPVVRDVQALDLEGCARQLTELTETARAGKLKPSDMRGSTISMSNHGVMGSLFAAPIIINQPESAILGVGKLEKRAMVESDGGVDHVRVRPMVYVTLTIDHRALDAFHTNRFLSTFVNTIQEWPTGQA